MAYVAPYVWQHGEKPTATNMNKYRDSLNYLYESTSDGQHYVFAAKWRQYETRASDAHNDGMAEHNEHSYCSFVFLARWLFYSGEGRLYDYADSANQVTLPNKDTVNVYDLDSIPWIVPGMVIKVTGVKWAMVDWNG
jgi:hypothetical protein